MHSGLEAVARARLAIDGGNDRFIEPVLSFTLNRFRFDDDAIYGNNRLPAAPDYALRGEVMYHMGNGLYCGPTFDIVGHRYADFVNSYDIDGYRLAGFRAGWSGARWSIYADVMNLTDEEYFANHRVRNAAAPGDAILNPGTPLSAYVWVSAGTSSRAVFQMYPKSGGKTITTIAAHAAYTGR